MLASTDLGSMDTSRSMLAPFLRWFDPNFSPATLELVNAVARKALHVIEFAILAVLVWRTRDFLTAPPRSGYGKLTLMVLGICAIFAFGSEVLQLFTKARGGSVSDALINMSGVLAGLGVVFLSKRFFRNRRTANIIPGPRPNSKKILFTADVHLNSEIGQSLNVLDQLQAAVSRTQADICVVAGDLGSPEAASEWITLLKESTPRAELVVCLGNHDHWIKKSLWKEFPTPEAVREGFWRPALREAGVPCLDFENVDCGDAILTGGYGHFDLSMKDSHLLSEGRSPSQEDYLAGTFSGLVCNDMRHMPNAATTYQKEARIQAEGIGHRVSQAARMGKPILLATHTAPFPELIGTQKTRAGLRRFFNAYSGNTLVGEAISPHADKISLAVCGHTHTHVPLGQRHGIRCANIGSDHGALRFVSYTSDSGVSEFSAFRILRAAA